MRGQVVGQASLRLDDNRQAASPLDLQELFPKVTALANLWFVQTPVSHNMESVSYHVYILRCGDGTYYTGQTTDLDKRVIVHNRGTGARYTRGRGPVQLVYDVGVATLREAFILERRIKRMPRAGKEKLIATAQTVC